MSQLSNNMEGTAGATIATVTGSLLGWISLKGMWETIALAIVGAVVGFITNLILKAIHQRVKHWKWLKRFF